MKCFECGKGNLVHRNAEVEGEVRGEQFAVQSLALVCDRCGHQAMEGADLPEHLRKLADAYRRAHRLLTSEDIRLRRKSLRMTQKAFAAYLGVGEASIKRWELGAIQDDSMDRYIRLKADPEEAQLNALQVAQLVDSSGHSYRATYVYRFARVEDKTLDSFVGSMVQWQLTGTPVWDSSETEGKESAYSA